MGTDYTNDPRPSPTDEIREYDYDPDATLYDADTNEPIGAATFEQVEASSAAANKDGGSGIIRVDRTTGALSETGRRVYTDGWVKRDSTLIYVAPDGERLDAGNPLNRRSIIEIHLKELARYLGVEFPGEMSEGITIADLTNHIIAGFFPEQEG